MKLDAPMNEARPPLRLSIANVEAASAWGFNCGPGALCAVTGMTPDEIRPHLGDFEKKRYTNPLLMAAILDRLGMKKRELFKAPAACTWQPDFDWTSLSAVPLALMRVQWDGPWCNEGVPVRARYRHTHWIATSPPSSPTWDVDVFDINTIPYGFGWIEAPRWRLRLVPWLLAECEPKATSLWWPTHVWSVSC